MIIIFGLLVLGAAAVIGVAGVATNSGGAHPLGDNFVIFGQHLTGLSTGTLFLWGIALGVVATLGLSLALRPFTRRVASKDSRRALKGSRRELADLRLERDRLALQLEQARSDETTIDLDEPTTEQPLSPSGNRHRLGQHASR